MKLLLHTAVVSEVSRLVEKPRASRLFFGPAHGGKATLALQVARRLNCIGCPDSNCHSCMMAKAGNHPDIHNLRPDEKAKIGIDAIQALQKQLALAKYHQHGVRAVVVEDADTMTVAAQNAFLKVLEEPPEQTVIMLTATDKSALLVTVQSRCQSIFIGPQSEDAIYMYLQEHYRIPSAVAKKSSQLSGGAVGLAIKYANDPNSLLARENIEQIVQDLLSSKLFSRLLAANALASLKVNVQELTQVLLSQIKSHTELNIAQNYQATESFRKRLAANVNPKSAYEALAVELAC